MVIFVTVLDVFIFTLHDKYSNNYYLFAIVSSITNVVNKGVNAVINFYPLLTAHLPFLSYYLLVHQYSSLNYEFYAQCVIDKQVTH